MYSSLASKQSSETTNRIFGEVEQFRVKCEKVRSYKEPMIRRKETKLGLSWIKLLVCQWCQGNIPTGFICADSGPENGSQDPGIDAKSSSDMTHFWNLWYACVQLWYKGWWRQGCSSCFLSSQNLPSMQLWSIHNASVPFGAAFVGCRASNVTSERGCGRKHRSIPQHSLDVCFGAPGNCLGWRSLYRWRELKKCQDSTNELSWKNIY